MSSVIAGVQHPFLFTIVFRANAQSVGISLRNVCRKPLLIKKNSIKGTYNNTPVRFIDSIFFYKTSEGAFPMEKNYVSDFKINIGKPNKNYVN